MMGFYKTDGCWHGDGVALTAVAARYPTPCYVYSHSALRGAYHAIRNAFPASRPQLCYAVKTNDNLSLLRLLHAEGAGYDIVSGGELARVLAAGGDAGKIVFSGVGKSVAEINEALVAGVGCFNVESAQELERIESCARTAAVVAPVAVRLTPNIDGGTHRHLTTGLSGGKFGVDSSLGRRLAHVATDSPHLDFLGFSCHIGSQISAEDTYVKLAQAMAAEVALARQDGLTVRRVDMGGGFAVDYDCVQQPPPSLARYDEALAALFVGIDLIIEPGRCIAAPAGVLLTRVEYIKESGGKTIWVVDAGMNDLIRPALYDGRHPLAAAVDLPRPAASGDVVGPVCENADILGKNYDLALAAGDLLAIFNAGAYCMVMASNYNARLRPAAVLLQDGGMTAVRRRETYADMMQHDF